MRQPTSREESSQPMQRGVSIEIRKGGKIGNLLRECSW